MYNFSYFKEKDKQTILDFIEENPFNNPRQSLRSSFRDSDGKLYNQLKANGLRRITIKEDSLA